MACVSRSELIHFLAGLAPELGAHVNGCSTCRMACSSEDVIRTVEAVEEVEEARRGTVIDERYVVEEILGAGTFGLVVRAAVRGGAAGEAVAIKLLRPKFNRDRETRVRFEREARILAGLRGRRICRCLAAGTTAAGTQYLVTELLRGETLRGLLERRGPMPIHVAARILTQVCEALGEAHASGIVHRDLKPDNVFVCTEDGRAEIKLLDFGVARALHDPRLTGSTQHVGSPLYTAPEQLSDPKAVGPAADIWSIGVMLQELITGLTPFDGPTVAVVCARILNGTRDAVRGQAAVVESILDRCLQHDPQRRYASVTELALALAPHAAAPADPLEDATTRLRKRLRPGRRDLRKRIRPGRRDHLRKPIRTGKRAEPDVATVNLARLRRRRRRLHEALAACSAIALGAMLWRIGANGLELSDSPPPLAAIARAPELPASPPGERAKPEPAPPPAPRAEEATDADPPPPVLATPRPKSDRAAEERGTLRITTTPWAWVTVANQKQETPAAKFELPPGLHRIRLDFPTLGISETHIATVEAGKTFTLAINKNDE